MYMDVCGGGLKFQQFIQCQRQSATVKMKIVDVFGEVEVDAMTAMCETRSCREHYLAPRCFTSLCSLSGQYIQYITQQSFFLV